MAMTTQGASIEVMTEPDVFFKEQRVDTPHGRVFVRDIPGDDPPIVLMHGFPDDHRVYDKLVPWLSSRRVVVFDWLGYGRSIAPTPPHSLSKNMGPSWRPCSTSWTSLAPYL